MPIFINDGNNLSEISEVPFKLEKDIQLLVEKNLKKIFGLDFVKTEFMFNGLRIDTLGFDKESNAFVIIEYKRDRNFSVIDQGFAYLSLLLNNKAEFILAYNELSNTILKKDDVDWSQSKVMFIAPSFTEYQKQAIGFKDLPIELWEVTQYSNKTILFNKIKTPERNESISKVSSKNELVSKVTREIKAYTEQYIFEKFASKKTIELYQEIKQRIFTLGTNIDVIARQQYIAFRTKSNFVYVNFARSKLHLDLPLRIDNLEDPKQIARNMEGVGHHGGGYSRVTLTESSQIPYIFGIIQQAYEKSNKN